MNLIHFHVLSVLFAGDGPMQVADLLRTVQSEGGFSGDAGEFEILISEMTGSGLVAVSGDRVAAIVDPSKFASSDDDRATADINAAMQEVSDRLGAATVPVFLKGFRDAGLDHPDTAAGVRVLVRLAIVASAQLKDTRLRGPVFRAARALDLLHTALVGNPKR